MQESMQSLRRVFPRKCTHSFKQLRAFVIKRKPEIFIIALQRKKLRGKNGPFKTTNSDNERENGKVSQDKINTKAKEKIKTSIFYAEDWSINELEVALNVKNQKI